MKSRVQGFVTLSLMGWLAVALAATIALSGLIVWAQKQRIESLQATLKAVEVIGEAAQKASAKRIKEDRLNKEKANAELKTIRGALKSANDKLRDYAGRSLLPAAAPGSRKPESICFSRPQLDGALQKFTSGTAELVAECELYRASLENAQKWANQ